MTKSTDKILILYHRTNKHLGLWLDLENDPRVILRCTEKRTFGNVASFVQKIYNKCNSVIELPFNNLWFQYYDIFDVILRCSHLIVVDGALNQLNISELKQCKKINPNIKISLYLLNSISSKSPVLKGVRKKSHLFSWDYIFTFDHKDAEKYGYIYAGFMYYSKHTLIPISKIKYDAHFVGGLKGNRTDLICSVYSYLRNHGVICDFNLMHSSDKEGSILEGVNYYYGWRPYDEVLQKVNESNCIVEILQEGQQGSTLRYFEAVCYNKKLLTNNPSITSFPFYDSRYMMYFSRVEDIDFDWIKKQEVVDYNYNNEFSPKTFVNLIVNLS